MSDAQRTKRNETMAESAEKRTFLKAWEDTKAPEGAAWVDEYRRTAWDRFLTLGFPAPKAEEWKYTKLKPVQELSFEPAPQPSGVELPPQVEDFAREGEVNLVFINGRLSHDHSRYEGLDGKVSVKPLGEALRSDADQVKRLAGLPAADKENPFLALNDAFLGDSGVFIHVPKGRVQETPIHVIHVSTEEPLPYTVFPRTQVLLGEAAEARVIESYVGPQGAVHFTGASTEVLLEPAAQLSHTKIIGQGDRSFHIGNTRVWQERDSQFESFSFAAGSRIARNNLDIVLNGSGCHAGMDGLYLLRDSQHVDNHTTIDHKDPDASSAQLYKGILTDKGRGVFNGKIFVRPEAQRTNASQLNKNLLLTNEAEIDTKPELQIDADDVKCSHGAAIGQLSPDEIFYLQSRGIRRDAAVRMLCQGFADEVLFRHRLDSVKERLRKLTLRYFTQGEG